MVPRGVRCDERQSQAQTALFLETDGCRVCGLLDPKTHLPVHRRPHPGRCQPAAAAAAAAADPDPVAGLQRPADSVRKAQGPSKSHHAPGANVLGLRVFSRIPSRPSHQPRDPYASAGAPIQHRAHCALILKHPCSSTFLPTSSASSSSSPSSLSE